MAERKKDKRTNNDL